MAVSRFEAKARIVTLLAILCCGVKVSAALHYVRANNGNAAPPYSSWATAAATIQDAIDVAQTGDQILVTNGVYQTGGWAINGLTNRVGVTNALVVESVNGPGVTVIQGYRDPDTTYSSNAVRCVYLADGASLIGFRIINGATLMTNSIYVDVSPVTTGGGVYCESTNSTVSNCVLAGNAAYAAGGGASRGTYSYCTFSNNVTAGSGGGASGTYVGLGLCILSHCTLSSNTASLGGGAADCILISDSSITDNFAQNGGGIAGYTSVVRCGLTNNSAVTKGGGFITASLTDCFVVSNRANMGGGGAGFGGTSGCLYYLNWADRNGGGGFELGVDNCLFLSNSCAGYGGGLCGYMDSTGTDGGGNSTFIGNSALYGGGISHMRLSRITLKNNSAFYGGGAYLSTLLSCQVLTNSATGVGGGGCDCNMNACNVAGNWSGDSGGGAGNEGSWLNLVLTNSTLIGNSASNYGGAGYGIALTGCLVASNFCAGSGGAIADSPIVSCTLSNCTLTGNTALVSAGGVYRGTLNNCIVYDNFAPQDANYTPYSPSTMVGSVLNYSSTTPMPVPIPGAGTNNITGPPLFVNELAGNYHLQTNSPCINAGWNGYVGQGMDLEGNPRIVGATVDMGAYELQWPATAAFHAWLKLYRLPSDGSADYADSDHDGMNNWQEWICGSIPTNSASVLLMLAPTNTLAGVTLSWQSVSNRTYFIERATNLAAPSAFQLLQANLPGREDNTTFIDSSPGGRRAAFYRVGVQQ